MTRALTFVLAVALPVSAAAQAPPAPPPYARCSTLAVLSGASFAAGDTGFVMGGAAEWGLNSRLSLEGKTSWSKGNAGVDLFGGTVNVLTRLTSGPVRAFVKGGLGVLVADIDTSLHPAPDYYAARLPAPSSEQGRQFHFTDPAATVGGGVTVQVSRRVSIRPEVEAIVAWRDAGSFVSTSVVVQVAYHFERQVVTPVRRR